jgi:hypothetical protein
MKEFLPVSMLMVLVSVLCGCTDESNAEAPLPEAQFVELNRGESTQATKKQTKVISSQADYAAELAVYTDAVPAPVDFAAGKVLLVDMGPRSSGGYSIGVTSVRVDDESVVANIRLVKPGTNCIVLDVLTNPYQFVFIPTLKEILISETLETADCPV